MVEHKLIKLTDDVAWATALIHDVLDELESDKNIFHRQARMG